MSSVFLYYLFCSLGTLCTLVSIVWLIQYKTKNAGIVDIFWGLSFPISATLYTYLSGNYSIRTQVFLLMIFLWGVRLAIYLYYRNWNKEEDPRYAALKKEWGEKAQPKMFLFYQFQAILSSLLSIPFILILLNQRNTISFLELVSFVLWFIALAGETIADGQMRNFKKNISNKGKVCDTGLWYYSRHPNYFFEWLIWVAFFLFALDSPYGWIGIGSPLLMLHFLLNVTGIKYSEEQMLLSKGKAYRLYQQTTSSFIPMPKKRISKEV